MDDEIAFHLQRLNNWAPAIRRDACARLGSMPAIPQEAIAALQAAVRDPDPDVAEAARMALVAHGKLGNVPDEKELPNHPIEPLSWFQTWKLALTRPSVATFEQLANDPNASSRRGYKWIFIAFFVGDVLSISMSFSPSAGFNCYLPISAVVAVILTFIYSRFVQWIAVKMDGTGTYSRLVYTFAASFAPIALISTAVALIPIVQYLVFPLFIYGLVLGMLAVRAVHQFGWGKAVASILTPYLLAMVLVAIPAVLMISYLLHSSSERLVRHPGYAPFSEALNQHFVQRGNNDTSVPTWSSGIDTYGANNQPQWAIWNGSEQEFSGEWLVIELYYTGTCTSTTTDPCNKLANETAQIVFDNYIGMDDIDGIGIIIGNSYFDLTVPPGEIIFRKHLTIEEWREELPQR